MPRREIGQGQLAALELNQSAVRNGFKIATHFRVKQIAIAVHLKIILRIRLIRTILPPDAKQMKKKGTCAIYPFPNSPYLDNWRSTDMAL
jgi:hypothetical protein